MARHAIANLCLPPLRLLACWVADTFGGASPSAGTPPPGSLPPRRW
ncbi:hypothetical protein [Saccharothrix deserti]|nr:hypothetical protein [Saccharothrix deserti]